MNTKIGFKGMRLGDALVNIIINRPNPQQMLPNGAQHHVIMVGQGRGEFVTPELESEERALKLAEAWFDVLKDIAVKCKDEQELIHIRNISDSAWDSLIQAKEVGLPIEEATLARVEVPHTIKKKGRSKK